MHCCRIADVGLDCRGAAAQFHNRPDKRLGRPGALRVVHEDGETISRKALGDRPADAARGARYNRDFAFRGGHLNAPDRGLAAGEKPIRKRRKSWTRRLLSVLALVLPDVLRSNFRRMA